MIVAPQPHVAASSREAPAHREHTLDGYRGLAALLVFFGHVAALHYFPILGDHTGQTFWRKFFWDASAFSVDFFFVLSGFVLTLPFLKDRVIQPVQFLFRRLVRLYPTHLTALLLVVVCRLFFQEGAFPDLSPLMQLWKDPVPVNQWLAHALLIYPTADEFLINPVLWSLIVEARMSLVLPWLIHFGKQVRGVSGHAGYLGATLLLSFLGVVFSNSSPYLWQFVVGILLARHHQGVLRWLGAHPGFLWTLLGLSLLLLLNRTFLPEYIISNRYISSVGAAGLIVCLLGLPTVKGLGETPLLQFAGRISYPFYLCHLPILLTVTSHLYPLTHSVPLCAAVTLLVSVLISWWLHLLVEGPSMTFLRRRNHGG